MRATLIWLRVVRRRFFPFWWPVIVLVGAAMAGLWNAEQQRQAYLQDYRASIRSDIGESSTRFPDPVRVQRLKVELRLSSADPRTYLDGYLSTIKVWRSSGALVVKDEQGRPLRAVKTPNAAERNGALDDPVGSELQLSKKELTMVQQQDLQPMMPARLVTTERTATRSIPFKATTLYRSATRFYEYGWYFLQHLIERGAGLVVVAVLVVLFSLAFAFQRAPKTRQNTLLQLSGVREETFAATSFGVAVLGEIVTLGVIVAGFIAASHLVNGAGSLRYPMVTWVSAHENGFMPLGQMLLQEGLLLVLIALFLTALVFLLAVTFGHLVIAVGGGIVALLLGSLAPIAWWSPFTYWRVHEIVDHFTHFDQPMTFTTLTDYGRQTPIDSAHGVLVLAAWTAGLVVLTAGVIGMRRWVHSRGGARR